MAVDNTGIEDHTGIGTKVELSLACTSLLDMDVFSKSDPFIVLYMNTGYASRSNADWIKLGRTEVIYDNLNPKVAPLVSCACEGVCISMSFREILYCTLI